MLHRFHQARPISTQVRSLKAALAEFLRAPSRKGGLSNEQLVTAHLGSKGIHLVDPPSFDAASLKYEKKCRTFTEAFYACWRGQRDWLKFDLETLRECDDLGALQLPERIEAEILRQEDAEERAAIQGAEMAEQYPVPEEEPEEFAPPLELRHRPGPSRRRRHPRRRQPTTARGRRRALRHLYNRAKAEYHRAGTALRCSHEKC